MYHTGLIRLGPSSTLSFENIFDADVGVNHAILGRNMEAWGNLASDNVDLRKVELGNGLKHHKSTKIRVRFSVTV